MQISVDVSKDAKAYDAAGNKILTGNSTTFTMSGDGKKIESTIKVVAKDKKETVYKITISVGQNHVAYLRTISVKEIPVYLSIDDANKKILGFLAYNSAYVKILEDGATIVFNVAENATVAIGSQNIVSGTTKIVFTKRLTDRQITIGEDDDGNEMKVTVQDIHFEGVVKVTSEDGKSTENYDLKLDIKGQALDKTKLIESREATTKYIGVHRSANANTAQLERVYNGVKTITDKLHPRIANALLKNNVKLLVLKDENEAVSEPYWMQLMPLEAIYVNNGGVDETLPDLTTGISTGELEFCYMTIYYAISTDSELQTAFNELKAAYNEAFATKHFIPGAAYVDGYQDPIHPVASKNNVLKYGSFVFNLYKVYYTKNNITPTADAEYKVFSKNEMNTKNPLAQAFMKKYFDFE